MSLNNDPTGTAMACYEVATALTYWIFKSRNYRTTPSNGLKIWTYLESSIADSAKDSTTIEDYLIKLSSALHSNCLANIPKRGVKPNTKIYRVLSEIAEIQGTNIDQEKWQFMEWQYLLANIATANFSDYDMLELCRNDAARIQILCRLRFNEETLLRSLNKSFVEVESDYVE